MPGLRETRHEYCCSAAQSEGKPPESATKAIAAPTAATIAVPVHASAAVFANAERQISASPHSGSSRNLVALARPYFGLIVFTTLLCCFGVVAMLRMPGHLSGGGLPANRRHCPDARPGKDVEVAVTRPIEEAWASCWA